MRACASSTEPVAGRYYLDDYLSEGNFGAVYSARHYAYGMVLRRIALKIGKQKMTDADARRAFGDGLLMAEVQDAAPPRLRDRFVTVHDAGISDTGVFAGHPYVAMELVSGRSLKAELDKTRPLPLKRAIATFDQILEAMQYMHERCYVHRDLKPSNIMVSRGEEQDTIKVLDFGLVQTVDGVLGWTDSGGDLAHLAPDAFELQVASPSTDVYMLGLIFYEMVTGANPFALVGGDAKGRELSERHARSRRVERFEMLESNPEVKKLPGLGAVVRKALAYEPAGRYGGAGELRVAWERAKVPGGDPPPLPDGPPKPLWERVEEKLKSAEDAGLPGVGEPLLEEAVRLNSEIPNRFKVGRLYLKMTEVLLKQGDHTRAWAVAYDGWRKRECSSTLNAMAEYYRAQGNSQKAAEYDSKAAVCSDKS